MRVKMACARLSDKHPLAFSSADRSKPRYSGMVYQRYGSARAGLDPMLVQLHHIRVRNRRQRAQLMLRIFARITTQADDLERHLLPRAFVFRRKYPTKRALTEQRAQHTMPTDRLAAIGQLRALERGRPLGSANQDRPRVRRLLVFLSNHSDFRHGQV